MVSVAGCLADGTITNHMVNWLSPFKERMTVSAGQDGAQVADTLNADLTFHANGEKATNLWESMASFRGVSEGGSITYSLQRTEPLYTEHTAFRDAITSDGTNIVTMREGLHTVRTVEAVLESARSEEHTSELQSRGHLVCRLLLEKKKNTTRPYTDTP